MDRQNTLISVLKVMQLPTIAVYRFSLVYRAAVRHIYRAEIEGFDFTAAAGILTNYSKGSTIREHHSMARIPFSSPERTVKLP